MMQDRTGYIRVINGNDFAVQGRFSGKDYAFKPDIPLDIPLEVAAHIFDFGKKDKSIALARLGWARTSDELAAGMKKLDKIVFDDPPELVEVPREKKKRGKPDQTGAAAPIGNSGTEGVGFNSTPDGPKIGQEEGQTF